ncbi:MAG: hypothetical protein V4560_14940 [Bacteroidota bacterium]
MELFTDYHHIYQVGAWTINIYDLSEKVASAWVKRRFKGRRVKLVKTINA